MMSDPCGINILLGRKAAQSSDTEEETTNTTIAKKGLATDEGTSDVSDSEIEHEEVGSAQLTTTERRRKQNAKFETW